MPYKFTPFQDRLLGDTENWLAFHATGKPQPPFFSMNVEYNPVANPAECLGDSSLPTSGVVCCMAGFVCIRANKLAPDIYPKPGDRPPFNIDPDHPLSYLRICRNATGILGLSAEDGYKLFVPKVDLTQIKAEEALYTIYRLRRTGEINWDLDSEYA